MSFTQDKTIKSKDDLEMQGASPYTLPTDVSVDKQTLTGQKTALATNDKVGLIKANILLSC